MDDIRAKVSAAVAEWLAAKKAASIGCSEHSWTDTMIPYRTGNLANNGIYIKDLGDGHIEVIISDSVAPYAAYIDEPGHYTEGWRKDLARDLGDYLKISLGGK
jgi:hypothetical protein